MAELLIHASGQELTGSVYIDRHRWQPGDVVVINEDGHKWGKKEVDGPLFRIVKLPGVPREKLLQLLSPDLGYLDAEAEKASRVLRRRAYKVDIAEIEAVAADTKPGLEDRALAKVREKSALVDPAVIGDAKDRRVIG